MRRTVTAFNLSTSRGALSESAAEPVRPPALPIGQTADAAATARIAAGSRTNRNAAPPAGAVLSSASGVRSGAGSASRGTLTQAYQQAWTAIAKGVGQVASDDDELLMAIDESAETNPVEADGADAGIACAGEVGGGIRDVRARGAAASGARSSGEARAAQQQRQRDTQDRRRRRGKRSRDDDGGLEVDGVSAVVSAAALDDDPWSAVVSPPNLPLRAAAISNATSLQALHRVTGAGAAPPLQAPTGWAQTNILAWALALLVATVLAGVALLLFEPRDASSRSAESAEQSKRPSSREQGERPAGAVRQ
jgi:hypothetical protein